MSVPPDPRRGVPSCSAFARLEACPRSFTLSIGQPDTSGADAESGTRIHKWLETQDDADWQALNDAEQETTERCYEQREAIARDWINNGTGAVTGAAGNSTGLVGTPQQVAEALLDYYDLGVTTFLIRGFDPLNDAVAYGRDLIPLVRELVAQRDAQPAAAAS